MVNAGVYISMEVLRMNYVRYTNDNPLSPEEKVNLLKEYIEYYEELAKEGRFELLNQKLPRNAVSDILDTIGCLLKTESQKLAQTSDEVKAFLNANPLPGRMAELLPEDFRVFVLILNSLKQWVMAESAYCDRYLMGGTVRKNCRKAIDHCLVTGEPLDGTIELHHPVRDGRPPIPLSKKGHSLIEGQVAIEADESFDGENAGDETEWDKLKRIRKQQNQSWAQLREGLMAIKTGSTVFRPNAKSFANKAIRVLTVSPEYILTLMDEHDV